MNELNDEINRTINTMQCDIDDAAHGELQSHLYSLLEIKRNELQQRLVERSWAEHVKPLTIEELKAGGWWCADTSEDALKAFILYGFETDDDTPWDGSFYGCFLYEDGRNLLDRGLKHHASGLKQIKRIGNEFYWGDA